MHKQLTSIIVVLFFKTLAINAQSGSGEQPPAVHNISRLIKNAGFDILSLFVEDSDVYSQILSHGCWCAKLNPYTDHEILGGPVAVDEIDFICKQWYRDV